MDNIYKLAEELRQEAMLEKGELEYKMEMTKFDWVQNDTDAQTWERVIELIEEVQALIPGGTI